MNKRDKKKIRQRMHEIGNESGFTENEIELVVNTFFENDDLLMVVRKHFLQGELSPEDKILISKLSPEAVAIIRKHILPEIDTEAPFHRVRDLWTHIDTTNKLAEDAFLDMRAQDIAIKYLDERLARLEGKKPKTFFILKDLVYSHNKDSEIAFVELKARNMLITHIDAYLEILRTIAISNAKIEDEEKLKMLDSNQ